MAHHPSKRPVLLIDKLPSLLKPAPRALASSQHHETQKISSSMASGCWITPPLPDANTFALTSLLSACHPHALKFYDRIGVRGQKLGWKLYRKPSVPLEEWELKQPGWIGVKRSEEDGETVFACEGDEFRFFDEPRDVLSAIVGDALQHNPAFQYMADLDITHIEPKVTHRRFADKISTHVNWKLHSSTRPPILTHKLIIATGSEFPKSGPSLVPELQHLHDTFKLSMGSVLDLESSTPFPPYISQRELVLAPLACGKSEEQGVPIYRARLGSTQRVAVEEINRRNEQLIDAARSSIPGFPQKVRIVDVRSGERLYRPNRLPIVGPLMDAYGTWKQMPNVLHGAQLPATIPRLAGLYFIGGMGSRGYTMAPLLSRILTQHLDGPFDARSALMNDEFAQFDRTWSGRLSPRRVLQDWFRRHATPPPTPLWNVRWPSLIVNTTSEHVEPVHSRKKADVIPDSWDPARTQLESTYCPLFEDDHTKD